MLTKFPKILIIIFLSIFIIQLVCLLTLFLIPKNASAGASFTPQVPVPGYTFDSSAKSTKNIAEYVKAIYKYAIGIVGIIAAVVLMFGGILWITAGGNSGRIGEAKSWIGASLAGLLIALTSYLILATVNPALVNFKITGVAPVQVLPTALGCCEFVSEFGNRSCKMAFSNDCTTENGNWKGANYSCDNLGQCLIMKTWQTGEKECKPGVGEILQKTTASTNLENICRTSVCPPKTVSSESYYIQVGTGAGGYCCICNK